MLARYWARCFVGIHSRNSHLPICAGNTEDNISRGRRTKKADGIQSQPVHYSPLAHRRLAPLLWGSEFVCCLPISDRTSSLYLLLLLVHPTYNEYSMLNLVLSLPLTSPLGPNKGTRPFQSLQLCCGFFSCLRELFVPALPQCVARGRPLLASEASPPFNQVTLFSSFISLFVCFVRWSLG